MLRNHQRKLAPAHHHLEEIQETFSGWVNSDDYVRVHDYDRDARLYRIYVEVGSTFGGGDGIYSGPGELRPKERTLVFEVMAEAIDPDAEVYMDVEPVPDMTFSPDTPTVGGESIVKALSDIYNHVVSNVVLPLSKYLA